MMQRLAVIERSAISLSARCGRRWLSTVDGDGPVDKSDVDRNRQVSGAMQSFLSNADATAGDNNIWAKLKNDVTAASESRPKSPYRPGPRSNGPRPAGQSSADKSSVGPRPVEVNPEGSPQPYLTHVNTHVQGSPRPMGGGGGGGGGGGNRPANAGGNSRFEKPAFRRPPRTMGGGMGDEEEGGGRRGRGRSSRGSDDEEMGMRSLGGDMDFDEDAPVRHGGDENEEITPFVMSQLFNLEPFQEAAAAGQELDTEDDDAIEDLLATAFMESLKSPTHSFHVFIDKDHAKVHLPRPRSSAQLWAALQPNILAPRDSEGYANAKQTWTLLGRNPYYNDREKRSMTNMMATLTNNFNTWAAKVDGDAIDITMGTEFQPGLNYLIQKEEELANQQPVRAEDNYETAVTDWSSARAVVVDEDQL